MEQENEKCGYQKYIHIGNIRYPYDIYIEVYGLMVVIKEVVDIYLLKINIHDLHTYLMML